MGELIDKIKGNVNEAIGKAKQQSNDPETRSEGAAQEGKGKAQQLGGKIKEGVGKATDNERLEAEGRADQTAANLKQAGDDVKDAFR